MTAPSPAVPGESEERSNARPTARTGMEWLMDYHDCLMGEYGAWWQERGHRLMEDEGADMPTDGTSWKRWREIRQHERSAEVSP